MMIDPALFTELVKRRCGLTFEDDRRPLLESALRQRMAATGLHGGADYFTRLLASDREFNDLVSLLTINETYFFREPQHLTLMAERLVPRLLARPGRTLPLRILSAGCSTGEEPYSIAMTLRERYGEAVRHSFRVHGSDIDRQALAKARAGRYTEFSFRGVGPELKARYFRFDGTGYALLPAGREIVDFMPMNLLDEALPETTGRYDIIFLRNVTIYFDAPTRRDIQRRMRTLLGSDGYLLVGMAETLANDFGLMPLVQEDGLFYFAGEDAELPPCATPEPPPVWPPPAPIPVPAPLPVAPAIKAMAPPPEPVARPVPAAGIDEAGRLTWERSYDRALAILGALDAETAGGADGLSALLLQAHIYLNRKEFARAEAAAQGALEREPWSIDAFLVLGLAARYTDRPADALGWFKRAVYASHGCWPAHYYLADQHRSAGDLEQARSGYRTALKLLATVTKFDTGLKVLLPAFPVSDIRFLCEHQLTQIEARTGAASPPRLRVRS